MTTSPRNAHLTLHDNAVAITEERYRQPKPRPTK